MGIFKKTTTIVYDYNPEVEKPIIRASICTGEKAAGFKNIESGKFHEVMLIRNAKDEQQFMQMYNLDHIDTEY